MSDVDTELKVAVLGLGIMGEAIANNLEQDDVLSVTWNRTEKKKSPRFCHSIDDVVSSANVLFILVNDAKAVSNVLDLIEPNLRDDHIVVQCATVKPDDNIGFERRVKACGAVFVEALIGGSKVAAIERKIPLYLGGDSEVVKKLEPLLARISGKRIHVGEVGAASVAKLAMNLNLAIQVEALCESYAFATSNGLTDDQYFNVLRNNTGWNYLAEYKEPKLRNKDYGPQFSVKNMLKDVRLALGTDNTDQGMRLLKETKLIYEAGEKSGYGDEDMVALYKMINN